MAEKTINHLNEKYTKLVCDDLRIVAAQLADRVYENTLEQREGWGCYKRVSSERLSSELLNDSDEYLLNEKDKHLLDEKDGSNKDTGYQVQLYKCKEKKLPIVNNQQYPRYIIAFAGTEWFEERNSMNGWEYFTKARLGLGVAALLVIFIIKKSMELDLSDINEDVRVALGGEGHQYNQAKSLGETLGKKLGADLLFTGHSLGGGLAACAASQSAQCRAITFDAMGVPKGKYNYRGNYTTNIENYYNNLDFLTCFQEVSFLAKALGRSVNIDSPHYEPLSRKVLKVVLGKLPLTLGLGLGPVSMSMIITALLVHDGRQKYLIPALYRWIQQQEDPTQN